MYNLKKSSFSKEGSSCGAIHLEHHKLFVKTQDAWIEVQEVQQEGSAKIDVSIALSNKSHWLHNPNLSFKL